MVLIKLQYCTAEKKLEKGVKSTCTNQNVTVLAKLYFATGSPISCNWKFNSQTGQIKILCTDF